MIVIELKAGEVIKQKTETVLKKDSDIQIALRGDYELIPGIEVEFRTKEKGKHPTIRIPDSSGFVTIPREYFFGAESGSVFVKVVSWLNFKKTVARVEIPYLVKSKIDKRINFEEMG